MESKVEEKEMCQHKERQEAVVELLRQSGGSMDMMQLLDTLTGPDYGFSEVDAVQALIDSSADSFSVNHVTGIVCLPESVAA